MKHLLTLLFAGLCIMSGIAQAPDTAKTVWKTLEEGSELTIPSNHGRISIYLQNVLDKESIVYWTQYVGGNERPENEIGPLEYRTIDLSPKISDENEPVRLDKKEIVLNTEKADKIVVKVEMGKIEIRVKE